MLNILLGILLLLVVVGAVLVIRRHYKKKDEERKEKEVDGVVDRQKNTLAKKAYVAHKHHVQKTVETDSSVKNTLKNASISAHVARSVREHTHKTLKDAEEAHDKAPTDETKKVVDSAKKAHSAARSASHLAKRTLDSAHHSAVASDKNVKAADDSHKAIVNHVVSNDGENYSECNRFAVNRGYCKYNNKVVTAVCGNPPAPAGAINPVLFKYGDTIENGGYKCTDVGNNKGVWLGV